MEIGKTLLVLTVAVTTVLLTAGVVLGQLAEGDPVLVGAGDIAGCSTGENQAIKTVMGFP
jgi:hypothetical protein